jgi:hypothetical protein
VGARRLGAPPSLATGFSRRRITPRTKLPHGAPRAIADDEGSRLVIIRLVRNEGSPEVALIAFRTTLDTSERHICVFRSATSFQRSPLRPRQTGLLIDVLLGG